jgi:transcriptional regulator with XRE-family HTH domain
VDAITQFRSADAIARQIEFTEIRIGMGVSQSEFSKLLGVSGGPSHVSKLERGEQPVGEDVLERARAAGRQHAEQAEAAEHVPALAASISALAAAIGALAKAVASNSSTVSAFTRAVSDLARASSYLAASNSSLAEALREHRRAMTPGVARRLDRLELAAVDGNARLGQQADLQSKRIEPGANLAQRNPVILGEASGQG